MKDRKYVDLASKEIPKEFSAETKRKIFEHQETQKCLAKKKYLTQGTAETRGAYYNNDSKRTKNSSSKSRAYQCPWCGFWHLSTNGR